MRQRYVPAHSLKPTRDAIDRQLGREYPDRRIGRPILHVSTFILPVAEDERMTRCWLGTEHSGLSGPKGRHYSFPVHSPRMADR